MRLSKTIRLIWTFYRSFIFASVLITICFIALFWEYGYNIFMGIFWFKILTLGMIFYFINRYKSVTLLKI
jgi:hypothetical protein